MKKVIALVLAILFALCFVPAALAEEETPETTDTPTAVPTAVPTEEPPITQAPTETPQATEEPEATPDPEETPAPEIINENARVTIGADLTEAQRDQIYRDFGITRGTVQEIIVTNAEERAILEGIVSERKIGKRALSCAYIEALPEGSGLTIELYNINYCTKDMYKGALLTAGVTDAKVIVSAPFAVSGTGALTGIYKAYESIKGSELSDLAKIIGAEELVLTGELSEYIGSEEATAVIAELKAILDRTKDMSDDEVRAEIRKIAQENNVSLTDNQINQLITLCRRYEGLDVAELQARLVDLAKGAEGAGKFLQGLSDAWESVKGFFVGIGNFFAKLFGGG
ncbi:MAG: DUF1002 domain-containing protein [Clostridiales bacterium]|nr:DUF1002 domain-containing protein [Clostridiales bacterium]